MYVAIIDLNHITIYSYHLGQALPFLSQSGTTTHTKIIRGGPNDKPNSGAVRSMANRGNETTLHITTELLSWPHEDSQYYYPLVFREKEDVKDIHVQCWGV